jgi:hypothetical protein
MVGEVSYVASHGYNLAFPINLNQVPEGDLGPNDSPAFLPYPQFQGIGGSNGTVNAISNYDSLQLVLTKRFTQGVSFSANYVWSHFMDDGEAAAAPRFGSVLTTQRPTTVLPTSTSGMRSRRTRSMRYPLAKARCS